MTGSLLVWACAHAVATVSAVLIINSKLPAHFIDIVLTLWHRKILSEAAVYGRTAVVLRTNDISAVPYVY